MSWFRHDKAPKPAPEDAGAFSLRALMRSNPGLAAQFLWGRNTAPAGPDPLFLHFGCGENVIDGFVNLDFIPHDARVHAFHLLDAWPEEWVGRAQGVYAEDTLEHFFHGEQAYILCSANSMLRAGGIARMLMPSYSRLADYGAHYVPRASDVMHSAFGVQTGADAVNMGMRFSGHRWLHDAGSMAALATMCGFSAVPASCARSVEPAFDGINLRDENDSLSFATDLRKVRDVVRTVVEPVAVVNATKVEELDGGIALYRSDAVRPMVAYALPVPVAAADFACLNVRSANLSSFDEHNQKWLVLDDVRRDDQWYFDDTLKSRACMNIVTRHQLPLLLQGAPSFSRLVFSPAARAGEYFTVGSAEVHALAPETASARPIV